VRSEVLWLRCPPSPEFFDCDANVLLNTTSKKVAGVAAALTILSYVATAVVSAFSAMQYFQQVWPAIALDGSLNIPTIILLGIIFFTNFSYFFWKEKPPLICSKKPLTFLPLV
jgi:hypothetical protein